MGDHCRLDERKVQMRALVILERLLFFAVVAKERMGLLNQFGTAISDLGISRV
jgi:hypothetical protein